MKATKKPKHTAANFTTVDFRSLRQLPWIDEAEEHIEKVVQELSATAIREAEKKNDPTSGPVPPKRLFADPSPRSLADAFLIACDGDEFKAQLVRQTADLTSEVERLRSELAKAAADLTGQDLKVFPFLQLKETPTYVRQATHEHAQQVVLGLPEDVQAMWAVLLLRAKWGGYVQDTVSDLEAITKPHASTIYRRLKVLATRALIVKHPRGFLLNPAIAECCTRAERFEKGAEFAAFYGHAVARRPHKNKQKLGHTTISGEQPIGRVLVGVTGAHAVAIYKDGGISAFVAPVTKKHAEIIISRMRKTKGRKFSRGENSSGEGKPGKAMTGR